MPAPIPTPPPSLAVPDYTARLEAAETAELSEQLELLQEIQIALSNCLEESAP